MTTFFLEMYLHFCEGDWIYLVDFTPFLPREEPFFDFLFALLLINRSDFFLFLEWTNFLFCLSSPFFKEMTQNDSQGLTCIETQTLSISFQKGGKTILTVVSLDSLFIHFNP